MHSPGVVRNMLAMAARLSQHEAMPAQRLVQDNLQAGRVDEQTNMFPGSPVAGSVTWILPPYPGHLDPPALSGVMVPGQVRISNEEIRVRAQMTI